MGLRTDRQTEACMYMECEHPVNHARGQGWENRAEGDQLCLGGSEKAFGGGNTEIMTIGIEYAHGDNNDDDDDSDTNGAT